MGKKKKKYEVTTNNTLDTLDNTTEGSEETKAVPVVKVKETLKIKQVVSRPSMLPIVAKRQAANRKKSGVALKEI